LSTLWQRFGRAARSKELSGTAILFAEKIHFDDEQAAKTARKEKPKWSKLTGAGDPREVQATSGITRISHDGANVDDDSERDGTDQEDTVEPRPSGSEWIGAMEEALRSKKQAERVEKQRRKDLDVGMDYLINAATRTGLQCRRKVFDVYFDSTASGESFCDYACDTSNPDGCSRCQVPSPTICCDLHNPSEFLRFTYDLPKLPSLPQRSRIPKYSKDPSDMALHNALDTWRETKTAAMYGWSNLRDHGPSLVMTNTTLEQLIDCMHHHKINTIQDLKHETTWADSDAEQYGPEILELIKKHGPPLPSLFSFAPCQPLSLGDTNMATSSTCPTTSRTSQTINHAPKRKNKCSTCGREGHNAHNTICPNHPSRLTQD
ncbi:hypothetical protein L210DRAFT_3310643, partial [Boletus edulis BED1]